MRFCSESHGWRQCRIPYSLTSFRGFGGTNLRFGELRFRLVISLSRWQFLLRSVGLRLHPHETLVRGPEGVHPVGTPTLKSVSCMLKML
ncbi:hypothetical protein HanIR_Chr06g0292131 [Helianthus annuus]|nr:hypothetical protein HanIR_Chr06g0292131 [Helianthus annuus]